MSGYKVESAFVLDDQISPKLIALMKQLEGMDRALATTTKAVGMLDAAFAATSLTLGALNTELGITSTHLYTVAAGAGMSAQAMRSMNVSAGASNRHFTRMNSQLQNISTHAASAQRAMVGLGMAMPVGGGGGGRGGGHGGGMGFFGGGLGEWMNKSMIAMIGFDIMKAGMHPSMEYAQQQQGLQSMGLNSEQMGRAERQAADIQRETPATNRTQNLKTIKELYGIFRKFDEAVDLAPDFAKFEVALQGVGNRVPSLKGHEDSYAQAVAKSAETLGRLSAHDFREFINHSLQSYEGTGGLVNPLHTAQAIKFSRSAQYGKSDDWTFGVLSFLLEEAALGKGGGGSRGIGPLVTQIDKTFTQGHMDKRLMAGLASMNLFEGQTAGGGKVPGSLVTTTMNTGTTTKLKGMDLLIKNPFLWATQVALPAMLAKEFKGMSPEDALKHFQNMPGKDTAEKQANQRAMILRNFPGMQQQAGAAMTQFFMNKNQIDLFIANMHKAMTVQKAYNMVMESTAMKAQAAGQQMYTLSMQLGELAGPGINLLLDALQESLSYISDLGSRWPEASKAFLAMNQSVFGAQGPFRSIADAIKDIAQYSGPTIKLLDKMAASQFKETQNAGETFGKGAKMGAHMALVLQRESGGRIPASVTGLVAMAAYGAQAILERHQIKLEGATRPESEFDREIRFYKMNHRKALVVPLRKYGHSAFDQQVETYNHRNDSPEGAPWAVNIHFNAPVNSAEHLIEQVKKGIEKGLPNAMMRQALTHQATAVQGGGGGIHTNHLVSGHGHGKQTGTSVVGGNP
jgi:hypothetical protein